MAKSRVKAQKTILEMWLSASDAELRKLETSPSREQHTRELDQKTPVISAEIPEDSANCGNVQDGEIQALKGLLRSDYARSSGQRQPLSPSTGDTRGSTLCQSCQSQLLSSSLNCRHRQQINQTRSGHQAEIVNLSCFHPYHHSTFRPGALLNRGLKRWKTSSSAKKRIDRHNWKKQKPSKMSSA